MPITHRSCRWELAVLLIGSNLSSHAQVSSVPREFSADIVRRDAGGASNGPAAKLHVSRQKTRIDGIDAAGGFFLTDGAAGTAFFVRPAQHVYLDAKQSTPLTQIFVPVDPLDPCPQWQAAAGIAGAVTAEAWQCARLASAMLDGHPVVEYRVLSPRPALSQRWIETALGFPLRLQAEDGSTIALENIRIEAQPPSLFSVPQDYRKLDPQALIEHIKHSDVWAAPEG